MTRDAHRLQTRSIDTPRGPLGCLDAHPPQDVPTRGHAVIAGGFLLGKELWVPTMLRLSRHGYRICAYDHLGLPDSPGPDDPDAYTLRALAEDMLAVARGLDDGNPVHLMGSCFGGFVARTAVLHDPDAARSLTLISSGTTLEESASPDLADYVASTISSEGRQGLLDCVIGLLGQSPEGPPTLGRAFEVLKRNLFGSQLHHLTGFSRAVASARFPTAPLRELDLAKLVVYGTDDGIFTPETQESMGRRIGASPVAVDGASHSPLLERPSTSTTVLKDFLDRETAQSVAAHESATT
ncbi:pimeloyl-ACP methyl ester carboxylesterase [Saccharopolyspora lacisalsi]|uniref:Pimeloyl-ACP methyl ester carboxylesterase n=1 Tax=Halosaccharopolyspora lacisalsi TaxID=1000566 RepID=A0A839DZ07_9PSEU|nr:alpha/beta fold hydrolase [Halosaccharopolyspora lacisalsi]MBA8826090.1 pimeloyl-ACP methyl ester carboxylesterase [Halosaccharopolyspora lacisalsi]